MVWGSMSGAGCGKLQFTEGTISANMYCDTVKQSLIPSLRKLGCRGVFHHDFLFFLHTVTPVHIGHFEFTNNISYFAYFPVAED